MVVTKKEICIYIRKRKVQMLLLSTFFKSAMAVYRKENASIKLMLKQSLEHQRITIRNSNN